MHPPLRSQRPFELLRDVPLELRIQEAARVHASEPCTLGYSRRYSKKGAIGGPCKPGVGPARPARPPVCVYVRACVRACVRAHCLYEFVGNAYRAALQVTRTAVGHKVQSVQAKLVQPCSVDLSATKADLRMLYAVLKGVRRSIVNRHKVCLSVGLARSRRPRVGAHA